MSKDNITEKTLINPINRTDNGSKVTSSQLQEFSVDSILTDETNRTMWINGMPYGNAYVSLDQNENPIHGEIFNDFENNKAIGNYSHAEGYKTEANGSYSHAEGFETDANGEYSHAEGQNTTADNTASHAEGQNTIADNTAAHAEGIRAVAIGEGSHSEGIETLSKGYGSHAEGLYTITNNDGEHASGKYNDSIEGKTIFSVGIGKSVESRLNALEITKDGNVYIGIDENGKNPCNYPSDNPIPLQSIIVSGSLQNITYAELSGLADAGQLIPGKFYRITDYITTTSQENTTSAGHQFDIIVLALSDFTISEEAWAAVSESDTSGYFSNSNLSGWKIWYCLENDKKRFVWADEQNGKGVIYRMIDEFGNDCPYDFKNIKINDNFTFYIYEYSLTGDSENLEDYSLSGKVKNNRILNTNNIIPFVLFFSYIMNGDTNFGGYYAEICCNNIVINCDNIVIRGKNNIICNQSSIENTLLINNHFIFGGTICADNIYQSNS